MRFVVSRPRCRLKYLTYSKCICKRKLQLGMWYWKMEVYDLGNLHHRVKMSNINTSQESDTA